MKIVAEKYYVGIKFGTFMAGLGWWVVQDKIAWSLLYFERAYYDGRLWALRLGPFYACRGPY